MYLIHVLSLLIIEYLFKAYDLRITIHSIHAIDQSNPITNTRFLDQINSNQTTAIIIKLQTIQQAFGIY